MFQVVHRTLAAMLGSLAALAALAVIGDVSLYLIFKLSVRLKSKQFILLMYLCFCIFCTIWIILYLLGVFLHVFNRNAKSANSHLLACC